MSGGRFITLEGGEGVGKSTQARLLADALRARGLAVLLTREPGGTAGAEAIRELLLHPPGTGEDAGWGPRAEALLFAAARADHVAQAIAPMLGRGGWVVCDRFLDSSRAYQGGGSGLADDDLLALHRIGSAGLLPDLTLWLDVPTQATGARLAARDGGKGDAIGGRDAAYHAQVANAFAQMAAAEQHRFVHIDGTGTPEVIHQRILAAVDRMLGAAA